MTLDEVLKRLFPHGHHTKRKGACLTGTGRLAEGRETAVIGIVDGEPLTPEDVVVLADQVLSVVEAGGDTPIVVLADTQGQVMARHAEMIGLNEYCAHLAKCLLLASQRGHRTIGIEYGQAVAGAFLATALATDVLIAIEGASPAVMDLPSIARVTKLSEQTLAKMAKNTPVFAPGLDPMYQTGAIKAVWGADSVLADELAATLAETGPEDKRGDLGEERGGRKLAADVVRRVIEAAGAAARA